MKKTLTQRPLAATAIAMLLSLLTLTASAANKKTTVEKVTAQVELTDDVDYIVTGATPFGGSGVVDIKNTDHAVLILSAVKPSAALKLLATHVKVNGEKAVNNTNCQVKLYNLGCIIMPYGNDIKPLTVYSEQNFGGEECNDFGLENSGGYMNTLSDAKLNNRIRSFKLKRGYMVTFANRAGGRGYSRCFIAADADLEVAKLPGVLDNSISSYRVFKWYDAGKKNLGNSAGNVPALKALNVQSTYDWGQGNGSLAPDIEWVPNHIYEDWPSSATIGGTTQSPHTKNNNEPRNSADDHPQELETILANWENMMRTGLRLCSPASWDGSDYWNATGFLADFLDSIDARGWRCDIIDLHCYWPESNFGNIANWANKYKRPVWISEWCWGASWNHNGAFADGVTENNVRDALSRICNNLNGMDYVERYFYWNDEADISKLYKSGKLTPAGEMYAQLDGGLAYNGKYNYAPKIPEQKDPRDLVIVFDKNAHSATLTWYEPNGELNISADVERRNSSTGEWTAIASVKMKETAATYTFEDNEATNGCQYRIHVVDANEKNRYSNIVTAASADLGAGDSVELDGVTKYIGGNIFTNGNFDMGGHGWTNGAGKDLAQPWFQIVPVGGFENGPYLQAYGNGSSLTESALLTAFDVKPATDYYFSASACNTNSNNARLCFTEDGRIAKKIIKSLQNTTSNWLTQYESFNSGDYSKVIVSCHTLGAKTQLDNLLLAQLFDTEEEAIADGVEKARIRAEAFMDYNTHYIGLNMELYDKLNSISSNDQAALFALESAVAKAIQAYDIIPKLDSLIEKAIALEALKLDGSNELEAFFVLPTDGSGYTASYYIDTYAALQAAIDEYLPMTKATTQPTQPKFASATGWTTKCGTYTGGDQRTNSQDGVTFWNAWWSGINASEGTAMTMEVKQDVKGLAHGLYTLECKASTEHYCLSDQHGYMKHGDQTVTTPTLTANYFDLPTVATEDRWETLATLPVYVNEGDTVTIGFVGSKAGAIDNAWRKVGEPTNKGDKREGWWCATDFVLKHTPLYKVTVTPKQWNVVCLPYTITPTEGITLYQIVGVTSDYTSLCVEQTDKAMAGVPIIYQTENANATFLENGSPVASTNDGPGNLRGFLKQKTAVRVPAGYYYLEEGEWKKCTQSFLERPLIGNFTGIIRPFNDDNSNAVTIYKGWKGLTIPISGVTEEEMEFNNEKADVIVIGSPADVNGDGSVDVADISSIISYMSGASEDIPLENADVNGDGVVDVADIASVISVMAGE
jgi:hypothetical protein